MHYECLDRQDDEPQLTSEEKDSPSCASRHIYCSEAAQAGAQQTSMGWRHQSTEVQAGIGVYKAPKRRGSDKSNGQSRVCRGVETSREGKRGATYVDTGAHKEKDKNKRGR